MAKTKVGTFDYVSETLRALPDPGLLLVSRDRRRRPNAMTIGWGSIGIYWGQPIFIVPVRFSRYSFECLERTGDFTVNVLPRKLAEVAAFCGTVSGRDHDKLTEANLTAVAGELVKSPTIEECLISYECKIVHKNDVLGEELARELKRSYARGDYHRFFFGQILAVHAEAQVKRRL